MLVYAISDLHLLDDDQGFMFTPAKERVFRLVAAEVAAGGGTLLLTGDVFDFTASLPPQHGLAEFFREALGAGPAASRPPPPGRAPAWPELAQALRRRFPLFFEDFARLARTGQVQVLVGNHDCALRDPACHSAVAGALGISPAQLVLGQEYGVRPGLLVVHGNEFDAANRTAASCANPGSVMTSALYQGVLPALRALGMPPAVCAAVPAVRPEEAVVAGVEAYLGRPAAKRVILAFVRLLARNGYFRGRARLLAWLLENPRPPFPALSRALVTPRRVRRALPDDTRLKHTARRAAAGLLRQPAGALGGARPTLVVMGHTHELDLTPSYVNLGTWIDHVTGLSPEALAAVDRSLLVLRWDDGVGDVRDGAKALALGGLAQCPVLWRTAPPP